jgi:hypothetical protein
VEKAESYSTTELKMQGITQNNAGRGGRFHYSNKRPMNTRYENNTKDWRLSQMLEDWEAQQETKKKEEAIQEREKEQKELTKDLAKIIRT